MPYIKKFNTPILAATLLLIANNINADSSIKVDSMQTKHESSNTNKSADSVDSAIPLAIKEAMIKAKLSNQDFSFIITPLANTKANTTNQKTEAQKLDTHQAKPVSKLPDITLEKDEVTKVVKAAIFKVENLEKTHTKTKNLTIKQPKPLITHLITEPNLNAAKPLTKAVSYKADTPRTPASTMKLIPTFVALDTLGKDFHWFTNVYQAGFKIGDTLYGNIIIEGSGDPKFTHEKLQQLLYKVSQTGIKHIKGDIIIDGSIFSNVHKDPAKFDDSPLRPYNASPDGFLTNFTSITIKSYPLDNETAQLLYTPHLSDIDLPNSIAIRSANCVSNIATNVAPVWQNDSLKFNKALPNGCGQHTFYLAYPNPNTFSEHLVKSKWLKLDNSLSGKVMTLPDTNAISLQKSASLPSDKINNVTKIDVVTNDIKLHMLRSPLPIATQYSYPLAEQIYDINHHSNNVMTEQLTLSIAAYMSPDMNNQTTNKNTNGTINNNTINNVITKNLTRNRTNSDYPIALATINSWWQKNLTSPPPNMTNGSGLCRDCQVTVESLNELLGFAYKQPSFDSYLNSLGIVGVSGTIKTHKNRLPKSATIGRGWIKTGTLSNVTAMAGYIKGKSGQDYSVVGIINLNNAPYSANYYRPVLDAMIDWTAQH